ncbi:MAG TPA: type VI secretion system contractile sheath large subunit [Alphaproteobacteria bacterium]|nr:type VI secretion system contractile sheath large subunit [Alphaproteobacteria bacterium]
MAVDAVSAEDESPVVRGLAGRGDAGAWLPQRPLRTYVVDLALGRTEGMPAEQRPALEEFLAQGEPLRALSSWYGDRLLALPAAERRRIVDALNRDIAALDALLTAQVNAVLHHPRFQRLEASWRGIQYLTEQAGTSENVKLRFLQLAWGELCRDLERAIEFDQSQLFNKIYSEEFGMPGGEPFGVLIGDYEVHHRRSAEHPTDDVAALRGISQVAAAAFAPFIVGAAPALFGVDRFRDLGIHVDIRANLGHIDYIRWKSFQSTEDARFIGLTLPHVLMREPYKDDGSRIDGFRFIETAAGADHDGYLWGNAGYAFASVLMRAFITYGWFADIRGAPRDILAGGIVTELPTCCFETDAAGIAIRYSTDVALSEGQDSELSELGFMALCKCKDTDYSAFFSTQSARTPEKYDRLAATMNARLSSMLQYMFCVARFSHFIKVICRDRVGSFTTAGECQTRLTDWLRDYTLGNDDASYEAKAKYPLREAMVQVRDVPGKPGSYAATIHLRPHFQLDQVVTSFRLVTELSTVAAG